MPENAGHGDNINAVADKERSEQMPERMQTVERKSVARAELLQPVV